MTRLKFCCHFQAQVNDKAGVEGCGHHVQDVTSHSVLHLL
jgi:hypothetical protein